MQAAEIELKFPVSDPQALQTRLPHLGFHLDTPRTFEHNTLYDTPTRDLRAQTRDPPSPRVRRHPHPHSQAHRRHRRTPTPPATRSASRPRPPSPTRTPSPRSSPSSATCPSSSTRSTAPSGPSSTQPPTPLAHLVLDETPIGTYAELEGPTDWIDRTLAELNIDPATCLTDSYGKLFLDWKQRTGSPAEHLTFAEIASPVLTPR